MCAFFFFFGGGLLSLLGVPIYLIAVFIARGGEGRDAGKLLKWFCKIDFVQVVTLFSC